MLVNQIQEIKIKILKSEENEDEYFINMHLQDIQKCKNVCFMINTMRMTGRDSR